MPPLATVRDPQRTTPLAVLRLKPWALKRLAAAEVRSVEQLAARIGTHRAGVQRMLGVGEEQMDQLVERIREHLDPADLEALDPPAFTLPPMGLRTDR